MVGMPSKRHTHTVLPYIFHLPRFYRKGAHKLKEEEEAKLKKVKDGV